MTFVSKIDDVFDIRDRGCVVVPGIPYDFSPSVPVGARIEIRNPSGRSIRTHVKAFEMINRGKPIDAAPFLLPGDVKKEDIQLGAEIYLLSSIDEQT